MDRRLFILAALALGGCATGRPRLVPAPEAVMAELEPLYGVHAGRDALTIRVSSNGCTAKDDITFYVERRGGAVRLAFGRRRIDSCRALVPGITELAFTWGELGLTSRAPVVLLNPLAARTGPGR
jgi:hypothetical protein